MSGAQAKAAVIAGASCIVAESNAHAAYKRHEQGWLTTVTEDVDDAIDQMLAAAETHTAISIGFVGNIVELWERLVERDVQVDLGSDQTSLHNPFQGGYFPAGFTFDEASVMLSTQPERFADEVRATLRRHASAINHLSEKGMYFWDYGNAFLLEASRAGAEIMSEEPEVKLLIMLNKQDLPNALTREELLARLNTPTPAVHVGRTWYQEDGVIPARPAMQEWLGGAAGAAGARWQVQPCVATTGEGLFEGLDWLLGRSTSGSAEAAQ